MIFTMQDRIQVQCTATAGYGHIRWIKVFMFTRRLYPDNKRGWRWKIRVSIKKRPHSPRYKTPTFVHCCQWGYSLKSSLVNRTRFHAWYLMWSWEKMQSFSMGNLRDVLGQFGQGKPTPWRNELASSSLTQFPHPLCLGGLCHLACQCLGFCNLSRTKVSKHGA